MIEIEYKHFHDRDFRLAIQKISQAQIKSPLAFRVKEVVKKLQEADNTIKANFKEAFGGTYFQLNEKGEFMPGDSPIGLKLQSEKTFKDFQEAEEEFNKRRVVVNAKKLTSKTLGEAVETFSASELIALEPIYQELAEVAGE
jgi:hypothetical protein